MTYKIIDNEIHITRKDYRKASPDYTGTIDGIKMMMALDPKTGGTCLFPIKFIEVLP